MSEALSLSDVTLALGGRPVLADVSFSVRKGEFIGLLGPNGAGKTTLLRALLGLVRPAAGRIAVLGAEAGARGAAIGYMPQARGVVAPRLRGFDFVASAADGERWGLPIIGRERRREVERAIALVGGEALAGRTFAELSGGERQRLLLAQALIGRPRLLLLDEPLMSLDPSRQRDIVELVADLSRTLGLTVIFSAHEINPLVGAIDRVLYLGGGQAAIGGVDDVITGEVLSRLYGTSIDVIRVAGRIFVMAGAFEVERDEHRHDA